MYSKNMRWTGFFFFNFELSKQYAVCSVQLTILLLTTRGSLVSRLPLVVSNRIGFKMISYNDFTKRDNFHKTR